MISDPHDIVGKPLTFWVDPEASQKTELALNKGIWSHYPFSPLEYSEHLSILTAHWLRRLQIFSNMNPVFANEGALPNKVTEQLQLI